MTRCKAPELPIRVLCKDPDRGQPWSRLDTAWGTRDPNKTFIMTRLPAGLLSNKSPDIPFFIFVKWRSCLCLSLSESFYSWSLPWWNPIRQYRFTDQILKCWLNSFYSRYKLKLLFNLWVVTLLLTSSCLTWLPLTLQTWCSILFSENNSWIPSLNVLK